jgi:hypothetical protein
MSLLIVWVANGVRGMAIYLTMFYTKREIALRIGSTYHRVYGTVADTD